jgi:sugar phosphate isomerase/epimerase
VDAGVKGVEFTGLDVPEIQIAARANELRRFCKKIGLKPVGYCIGAELLVPFRAQRDAVARLKQHVDAAVELGVPSMRHDVTRGWGTWSAGLSPKETFARAVKIVVPAIREVADYAEKKKIKTSLENHGFYMQAAERVERLIRAVNHPNFGLTIDLGNFLCVNDNPVTAVKRLAKFVIMAHAKDFHVRPKSMMPKSGWFATPTNIALRGAICGHGVIDVAAQLKILKQSGYDGWLSLEFEGMEEATQAVRLGLDYLREQLAALK